MRFQTLIYRALISLNDGHTMFSSACFHRTASYYLPLPLVAVVEDGNQIIRVAPSSLLLEGLDVAALVLHQFDYYRYEGAQVTTINGAPAMDYLLEWAARYVGQYRDSGVRFNLLFARRVVSKATGAVIATQGAFAQRSLAPTNDSVVVELILAGMRVWGMGVWGSGYGHADVGHAWGMDMGCGHGVWTWGMDMGYGHGVWTWGMDMGYGHGVWTWGMDMGCGHGVWTWGVDMGYGHGVWTWGVDMGAAAAAAAAAAGGDGRASSVPAPNDLPGAQKLSTATALIPVYLLADNATAVIWLHTFLPALDGSDEALIAFLLTEISTAVDLANQHGKRILMDVSGNGGGYADIAYLLLRLVAGKHKAPKGRVQMPQQLLISNAFMLSLLDKQLTSFYQWDKYVRVDETTPVKSARDFKPFQEETFSPDGQPGVYSGLFKLATFPGLEKVPFRGPVFGTRPLVIVTNGNCFSACAIFTHNLRKRFNVKHVTVGGVLGQPLGISASCMGATMPSLETGVTNFLTGTKLADHPRAPKPFPYNVVQGVAVVQGYVEDKVPCEYVFLPGDQHVDLTMDKVANPALVWTEASQYF
ncbi:unnamed protein product [Closterium sp. Yama58-4]|nr:unnamed protein product [Closterium sp. Yama58-4]